MAVDIHKLIATISPDVYCDQESRAEVKKLVKEKGYLEATAKAKPFKSEIVFNYDEAKKAPFDEWGIKAPCEVHELVYDSPTEGLEPLYFWLLDFMGRGFADIEKVSDNFTSTPGSGHFSELGGKATTMQQQAMNMLGAVNTVIKSILGIVYNLKEFKLKLDPYDKYTSGTEAEKQAALLSLKQTWLDNVDIKRGGTSIKGLAVTGQNQPNYVTLINAFMVANTLKEVDDLDLNDQVKRILKQRLSEFIAWLKESDKALRQRFEIEKKYLKSQVSTVKLYARWIKPYLKAARKLEQKESTNAALVTAFNTILLELTLLAKDEYKAEDDVKAELLPKSFLNPKLRTYTPLVVVEFTFRGIPSKTGQHYTFGGRAEIKFSSYALHKQELDVLKAEMEKDEFGDVLQLIEGATKESIEEIEKDIDDFLDEDKKKRAEKKEEEKKKSEDTNPFSALFSIFKREKNTEKEDLSKGIKPDNTYEKVLRSQAIITAREKCFIVFDTYKKAHAMPSHYNPFEPL